MIKPKVLSAWNLHNIFFDLEIFVILRSIIGNFGHAAYPAASTFLYALAQNRTRRGLPGATISLGALQGVGYIADNSSMQASVEKYLGV